MTRKIYNEDFKIAAAMLARGQGYTLKNAAESLGVDPGSTCLWVRKYAPVTAAPALDASPEQLQRENQRLREENRRLLMEREILKKRRHSSRRSSREICLHQRSPGSIPRRSSVWCPPGFAKWLLRLESTTVQSWRTASDPTRGRNPASPRQEPRYLRPRVFKALKAQGVPCCENTMAKLMRVHGVRSKAQRPFVVQTTDSRHDLPVAGNVLNREFYPDHRNEVWTADITYIPTAQGWLYLAVVLDLFSRRVVGWATADHMRSELTCAALRRHWSTANRRENCYITAIEACNTPASPTRISWPNTRSSRA